jgi:hypothetical protein
MSTLENHLAFLALQRNIRGIPARGRPAAEKGGLREACRRRGEAAGSGRAGKDPAPRIRREDSGPAARPGQAGPAGPAGRAGAAGPGPGAGGGDAAG